MKKLLLIILISTGGYSMSNVLESTTIIPLEDFFKNPEKSSFQLSPNGKYISYMKPWVDGNRRMNIFVKNMLTNKETRLTSETDRSIYGYFWLSGDRLAYVKDQGGDENIHIFDWDIRNYFNIALLELCCQFSVKNKCEQNNSQKSFINIKLIQYFKF